MSDLPEIAISIRQPWTWAIVHNSKRHENRDWKAGNPARRYRGPVCLHAGLGMRKADYIGAAAFMDEIGVACPMPDTLPRGGIIGTAEVVDLVDSSLSPWFFGPQALLLTKVQAVPFIPVHGALGFFKWQRHQHQVETQPARWMTDYARQVRQAVDRAKQGDMDLVRPMNGRQVQ